MLHESCTNIEDDSDAKRLQQMILAIQNQRMRITKFHFESLFKKSKDLKNPREKKYSIFSCMRQK